MNPFRSNIGTLNEILFKDKNKSYGAYAIRSAYGSTVFKSLGITAGTMLGMVWSLSVLLGKPVEVIIPVTDDPLVNVKIIEVDFEQKKEITKPAADKTKSAAAAMQKSALTQFVIKDKPADSVKVAVNDPLTPVGSGSATVGTETTTVNSTPAGTLTAGGGEHSDGSTLFPEVFPAFPGGLKQFWASNIRYPNEAREAGTEGRVVINFVIDEEGNVESCRFTQKLGHGCEEEIMRVVKLMPKWKPGTIGGKPVKVSFKQAVEFKLK